MFGESSLSISYLFLFSAAGLAAILLTQGHVKGSRQYHASPAHFLWLLQQLLGTLEVLGLFLPDCEVPDEFDPEFEFEPVFDPPLLFPLPPPLPPLRGAPGLKAATWGASSPEALDGGGFDIAATPALNSVVLLLRNTLSAALKTAL